MIDSTRELLADAQICLERAIAAYAFSPTSYTNEAMHHCMRLQKKIAQMQSVHVGDRVRRPDVDAFGDDTFSGATFTVEFITHDGLAVVRWDQKPDCHPFVWEIGLCEVVAEIADPA